MNQRRSAFLARLATSGPFGFGASSIGNLYREVPDDRARATIDACWDQGVRYFDTAPFYGFGLSERRLGDGLRDRPREDFILSTKVGRRLAPGAAAKDRFGFCSPMPFEPVFDYSYDGVMRSFEASLHRLGLSRIDILYMHDIDSVTHGEAHTARFREAIDGGFRALAELRDQGLIAAIGLGVNEVGICADSLAHADFDLFMIAGRYTLLNQGGAAFFDTCRARGIGVVAAGVFNSGVLATGAATPAPHYDYAPATEAVTTRVAAIEQVCEAYGVPLAAAALQFVTAHPAVTLAVIGTASPARIGQTLELASHRAPAQFWLALRKAAQMAPEAQIPN